MRKIGLAGLTFMVVLISAEPLMGQDLIVLKNGVELTCRIVAEEEDGIRYSMAGIEFKVYKGGVASVVRAGEKTKDASQKEPAKLSTNTPKSVRVVSGPTPTFIPTSTPVPEAVEKKDTPAVVAVDDTLVPPEATSTPDLSTSEKIRKDIPPFPYPGKEPLIPLIIPGGKFRLVTTRRPAIRKGPNQEYPKVGNLDKDDIVYEVEEEDAWYRIKTVDDREGWVLGELTEPIKPQIAIVNGVRVSLRKQPGVDQELVRPLEQGEVVVIMNRKGEWVRISDLDGQFGWVAIEFLDVVADERVIRNPVFLMPEKYNSTFAKQALSLEWIPAGQDVAKLKIRVHNEDLVRGGRIVLMGLRDTLRSEKESPGVLFSSEDLTWQQRAVNAQEMQDLGLAPAIVETTEEATVAYLRGEKADFEWNFTVDVDKSEMQGTQLAVVIQKGNQRGACVIFAESAP